MTSLSYKDSYRGLRLCIFEVQYQGKGTREYGELQEYRELQEYGELQGARGVTGSPGVTGSTGSYREQRGVTGSTESCREYGSYT
ncbi:hypothetical protein JTB14_030434 [Gonioctena quinquepunctata]|nr:hypothetical protein JTB14_030434 [Gonioctena quinquepunctata]